MKLFQTFICTFVLAAVAYAQPISAGLKIGVPLTDAFNTASGLAFPPASVNDYELGGYVELRLPARFSVEGDVLWRGYTFNSRTSSTSASSWEFPIVAKYHLLKGPIKPYVEGGLSFSHISDIDSLIVSQNHTGNFGIVLGGGIEIHALVLRISPEVRYTGNFLKTFDGNISSNRNQVAFLVGIGF